MKRKAAEGRPSVPARIGLGLLGALVGLVVYLLSPWGEEQVGDALAMVLAFTTGERVTIEAVELLPLEGGLRLRRLEILRRAPGSEFDRVPIASLESLELQLAGPGPGPLIDRVVLVRPRAHLHFDADGLREFRRMERGGSASPPSTRLPWRELEIRDADIRVEGKDYGLDIVDLDVIPDGEGSQRAEVGELELRWKELRERACGLRIPGVRVGPDRFAVPDLQLNFDHLTARGRLAAVLGGEVEGELDLALDLEGLGPLTGPAVQPHGLVLIDLRASGQSARPQLSGALAFQEVLVHRQKSSGKVAHFNPGPMTGLWTFDGDSLELSPLRTRWGGGLVEISASLDVHSMGLYAMISGESISLRELLAQADVSEAPWVEMDLDLESHLAGTLQPLAMSGSFEIVATELEVRSAPHPRGDLLLSVPRLELSGQADIDPHRLHLQARRLASPRSVGEVDAWLELSGRGSMDAHFTFSQLDLSELRPLGGAELKGLGRLQGRLWGPYKQLSALGRIQARDFGVIGVQWAHEVQGTFSAPRLTGLAFEDLQARWHRSHYSGRVALDFTRDTWLDIELALQQAQVADLVRLALDYGGVDGPATGTVQLHGPASALDGLIALDLQDTDLIGERFDQGRALARFEDSRITLDDLRLTRAQGEEGLVLRGSVEPDWRCNLDLRSFGLRLERMTALSDLGGSLTGRADLQARIGGALTAPLPRGRLTLSGLRLSATPLADSAVDFDSEGTTARIRAHLLGQTVDLAGTLGLDADGRFAFGGRFDELRADSFYSPSNNGSSLRASLSGTLELAGALGRDDVPVTTLIRAPSVEVAWGQHLLQATQTWEFRSEGRDWRIEQLTLSGGETRITMDGERKGDQPAMFVGQGQIDMDLMRAFVPDLQRARGLADLHFKVHRVDGRPRPEVQLALRDVDLEGDWFPEPLEEVNATLRGSPQGYTVEGSGRVGGGTWQSTGSIQAESWLPQAYNLRTTVQDARVQMVDFLPPITGDAQLELQGPAQALLLHGDVQVHNMFFGERIDWESWVIALEGDHLSDTASESTGNYFSLDIDVHADRTIHLQNNVGDFLASAELTFEGDTNRTGMRGRVWAEEGGLIYIKEREFRIGRGELHFDDPYAFDPGLDFSMSTQVRDYQIDMAITGFWSDWLTSTRSDPGLPQADINALLIFGMTREELERYGGITGALVAEGGDLLASGLGLVGGIGEGVGDLLQVEGLRPERFDLVSGVDQRGAGTVASEVRVLAEWDIGWDSTFILEQNTARPSDLYLGLEKRLARKLYLRGYWASEQVGRSSGLGGAVGMDASVRWELD